MPVRSAAASIRRTRPSWTDAKEFQIENPALLAYWAPNRLRHARATEIRRTYGLEAAQVILGHAKADVTQVYAERDHGPGR